MMFRRLVIILLILLQTKVFSQSQKKELPKDSCKECTYKYYVPQFEIYQMCHNCVERVYVSDTNIINPNLKYCRNIFQIYISHSNIKKLPEWFIQYDSLSILFDDVGMVPKNLGDFSNIKRIEIINCSTVKNLNKALKKLELHSTTIGDIGEAKYRLNISYINTKFLRLHKLNNSWNNASKLTVKNCIKISIYYCDKEVLQSISSNNVVKEIEFNGRKNIYIDSLFYKQFPELNKIILNGIKY